MHKLSLRRLPWIAAPLALLLAVHTGAAQDAINPAAYIKENFTRTDYQIPMRDGVKLYTIVYSPKDQSQKYPILMSRTPYSIAPYEKGVTRASLGPSRHFLTEGYIFVNQDVRGCYMSEGVFVNMRPQLKQHKDKTDIDESTDTYDTIDWLVKNIANNNGKVGQHGISYPGFYTSAGMIDAHPALKASSPQAPIADWFFDDFFHHGAFFLPHCFNFIATFGQERPVPTAKRPGRFFDYGTQDGYKFFLDIGSLANVNPKYFKNKIAFWDEIAEHPNYDAFWQARNLLPHLKHCAPAVMTVGGWFDAEDLYGALNTYQAVEKNNKNFNIIVMGPWAHGAWSRTPADKLGNISFGSATADYYQREIELPFFNHYLKGKGEHKLPEATMFETGANKWRKFDAWPPKEVTNSKLYLHADSKLSFKQPAVVKDQPFAAYTSDPAKPVPFTEAKALGMTREYMTDDQSFASKRKDVVFFQTDVLTEDLTIAGPMLANLLVSTSGTDSDWVVKVIDVFPDDMPGKGASGKSLGGYQMMVRSEVIRGRFRNSYEKPEPFKPNEPTAVRLPLQDVLHTFQKGHRVMVQICSTWFPLVDRNPQKYVDNIFRARDDDFIAAQQRIYVGSALEVGILKGMKD